MYKPIIFTLLPILSFSLASTALAKPASTSTPKLRVTVLNHTDKNVKNIAKDTTLFPQGQEVGYTKNGLNGTLYPTGGAHWHMYNKLNTLIRSVITYQFNNGSSQYPVRPTICKIKTQIVRGVSQARVLPGTGCLNNGVHTYQIKTSIVGKHVTATIVQTR